MNKILFKFVRFHIFVVSYMREELFQLFLIKACQV
jgi:hypothetical protein